jgi:hypothetical protein
MMYQNRGCGGILVGFGEYWSVPVGYGGSSKGSWLVLVGHLKDFLRTTGQDRGSSRALAGSAWFCWVPIIIVFSQLFTIFHQIIIEFSGLR